MKHFIVATAGHVDHGKSSLVKALTGTDPDRLPEERARQITIDLGFAELDLRAPNGEEIRAGLVDVPGHEDFVKNMIAGVGSIDLALLIVAADDGWMPQTEEHFQILTHLGVRSAVIALTKSDLIDSARSSRLVRDRLRSTVFENAPLVATSTLTGAGLDEIKQALARELAALTPPADLGKPRLFVDRAFSLHGIGTVVTGTLTGGTLRRDQSIVIQPGNISSRIRRIQSHKREAEQVGPGMRVALNLSDVTANTKTGGVARGDVITIPELGDAVRVFDAVVAGPPSEPAAGTGIKSGAAVYVHHGTKRVPARVSLAPGPNDHVELAQITLESPIFALVGDRFILRNSSERRTLAGGIVLDLASSRRQFRSERQRQFLHTRAIAPHDPVVAIRSELRRDGAKPRHNLLLRSKFYPAEIATALQALVEEKAVVSRGDLIADAPWWSAAITDLIGEIDRHHREFPQSAGLDLAVLRSKFGAVPQKAFDVLMADLCEKGYTRHGNLIRQSAHHAVLPPELMAAAEEIRRLLSIKPFDPPARKEIAPDPRSGQALNFLIEQGELVDLGPDLVLSGKAFTEMRKIVVDFISKNGPATVSALRQALQTSRRIAVPFLERLDRERVTRRQGDERSLVGKL